MREARSHFGSSHFGSRRACPPTRAAGPAPPRRAPPRAISVYENTTGHEKYTKFHSWVYQAYWVFQAYRVFQVLDSYATVYYVYDTVYKGTPKAKTTR